MHCLIKSYHHENLSINFDPLKPHFYIVKLGFTGVYIIFPISAQNRHSGSVVEHPLCDWDVVGLIPGRVIPKTLKMVLAAL